MGTHFKPDTFGSQYIHTAIYHFLRKFKVGNAVTKQSTWHGLTVEYCDLVTTDIQLHGNAQSGRTCADNGYFSPIALGTERYDIFLAKSGFSNGSLILAYSNRRIAGEF